MKTETLLVTGMQCDACARAVTRALSEIDGVAAVHVGLADGRAVVDFDPAKTDVSRLCDAIADEGYEGVPKEQ